MSDLTVSAKFTQAGGAAAVGLALADIDLYLTEQDRATGADAVIWNGVQHPTEEIDNCGFYIRIYAAADLIVNNYFARAVYTGAAVLDVDEVMGGTGIEFPPVGTAIEFTYTLTAPGPIPIVGARIEVTSDLAGDNVVWCGETDTFGVARDDNGYLPRLQPGTYYFWRSAPGYTFVNPDTEIVS